MTAASKNHHEHHLPKRNLWQRWTAWNGSFLVISILLHVLLFGGATLVVVQVVQNRKEKMKFTAPPPSANASVEHKVKPSKKAAAAAPAISKRITSTAVNASIALPTMDLNSTGPDVIASVMSGMGASGLGAGSGGGAAGMASMPLAGLTAFGFKGKMNGGLVGHFYDLKQTPNHKPSDVIGAAHITRHSDTLEEFFTKGWDENVLKKYFQAPDQVTAFQIFMPIMKSEVATKAFGVEKEIKGLNWVVHYKGSVRAPKDGTFRFVGYGDDMMAVRFNKENVFAAAWDQPVTVDMFRKVFSNLYGNKETRVRINTESNYSTGKMDSRGSWFQVEAGKTYPIEIIASEAYGGGSAYLLAIEERGQFTHGPKEKNILYPIFALKKGIPAPPDGPPTAPEPLILPGN